MTWLEMHPVTVDLAKWVLVILLAWISGVFAGLRRFRRRPRVDIFAPAGFCYLEDYKNKEDGKDSTLAVFVLDPVIKNPSDRSFEIDRILLGYDCPNPLRRLRQDLFFVSFPSRPKKAFGVGVKVLPVFFSQFGDELDGIASVQGKIGPKSLAAAYVLFIANTTGSWRPRSIDDKIEVQLKITTVGEGTLLRRAKLRVVRERKVLDELCPILYDHVKTGNLWNLENR